MSLDKTFLLRVILLCCLCFSAGCGSSARLAQEQQMTVVSSTEIFEDSTQAKKPSSTVTAAQARLQKSTQTPAIHSTPLPAVEPLKIDDRALRLLPADDYLVYTVQHDLYIASLDGSIHQKIGSYVGLWIKSSSYAGNVFQVYDEKNNTIVFYRGTPEPFEKMDEIQINTGESCWVNDFSPGLRWQAMVCGETDRQIRVRDLWLEQEEVITSGGPGTDNTVDLFNLMWSPDAQWLVYFQRDLTSFLYEKNSLMFIHFSCQADQQPCTWEKVGPLIKGGEPGWGQYPAAWSPDSQKLAFITPDNPLSFEIFDLNTKTFRNVGSKAYPAVDFKWAPDGRTLIFKNITGIFGYSLADGQVLQIVSTDENKEITLVGWLSTHHPPVLK